jgi:hypothetical protein
MTWRSIQLTLSICTVVTIIGVSGWLLWQNTDPRLEDVAFAAPSNSADQSAEVTTELADVLVATDQIDTVVEAASSTAATSDTTPVELITPSRAVTNATTSDAATSVTTAVTTAIAESASLVTVSAFGPGVQLRCDVPVTEITVVHSVMRAASQQCGFSYSGERQGNLGFFVKEIAGLKQSVKDGQYWIFSVNGVKSQLGVSARTVESNDTIQWTYEAEY